MAVFINGAFAGRVSASPDTSVWARFSFHWVSSRSSRATIEIVSETTAREGNDFAIDDLSLVEGLREIGPTQVSIERAVMISFQTEIGKGYQVRWANDALPDIWNDLGDPINGTGEIMSVADATKERSARFYRVFVLE